MKLLKTWWPVLNVDYIAPTKTVLGVINSNPTFTFDLNYFFMKVKNFQGRPSDISRGRGAANFK